MFSLQIIQVELEINMNFSLRMSQNSNNKAVIICLILQEYGNQHHSYNDIDRGTI